MQTPYKIGYLLTIAWLVWIFYGFINYDAFTDEKKLSLTVFFTFVGLIAFPLYFIFVYLYYVTRKPKKQQ